MLNSSSCEFDRAALAKAGDGPLEVKVVQLGQIIPSREINLRLTSSD
jgi:hypothetical protein